MSRFRHLMPMDRAPGPAPFAPADGLESFGVYTAFTRSAVQNQQVKVVVPALGWDYTYDAYCPPNSSAPNNTLVLIVFDETKRPWVLRGLTITVTDSKGDTVTFTL